MDEQMMQPPIRISLAQLNPTVGAIEKNVDQIQKIWAENNESTDLIIFPELFLCGYPPEDLVLNTAFIDQIHQTIDELRAKNKDKKSAIILPAPWKDEKLYNAALLIQNGEIKAKTYKHKLPNDSVFDEKRTFAEGDLPPPIDYSGHKIGLMICEDLWHAEVANHLKQQGAEILITINGSPYHDNQQHLREELTKKRINETGLDVIYLNMFSGQDELVFDGASFVMNKEKETLYKSPSFTEDLIHLTLSNRSIQIEQNTNGSIKNKNEEIYEALKLGLKDYVRKNGFNKVILGLSGGIDSALTAAIAADALGSENVYCVMLPSEFTSQDSLDDAKQCANLLGVNYQILEIKEAVKSFENIIPDLKDIAHENTQSRIRGVTLMALSNMTGALLLTTGNKSEMAVGYCTLYGDMNGAFNPIKDVYKTKVYELSNWRNTVGKVIPERIITKAPTAELKDNQKDQDRLPPYDILDSILQLIVEYDDADFDNPTPEMKNHLDNIKGHENLVPEIAKLLKITEYKRYQAPPGTRITSKAFGRDRRYPMTNHFVNRIAKHQ